jgi:hypothetical protein
MCRDILFLVICTTMMRVAKTVVAAEKQMLTATSRFMISGALGPCSVIIPTNDTMPETEEGLKLERLPWHSRGKRTEGENVQDEG